MIDSIVKNYLHKAMQSEKNDVDRSQAYYKKAFAVCEQCLGKDHPETKRIAKLIVKKTPSLVDKITIVSQIEEMKVIRKS